MNGISNRLASPAGAWSSCHTTYLWYYCHTWMILPSLRVLRGVIEDLRRPARAILDVRCETSRRWGWERALLGIEPSRTPWSNNPFWKSCNLRVTASCTENQGNLNDHGSSLACHTSWLSKVFVGRSRRHAIEAECRFWTLIGQALGEERTTFACPTRSA